jgi:hypothetical protein
MWLSFLDAGAIIAAPLSGYLLESVGFSPTALITIALGIMQHFFLLIAGSNSTIMILSFASYAIYRAFLFPYFFASLSRRMGFRFFGFLSGISFCASGFTQFAVAPIALMVEGDCHQFDTGSQEADSCTEGNWVIGHCMQIAVLTALMLIPFFDTRADKLAKAKSSLLSGETESLSAHSSVPEDGYGAVATA